MVGSEGIYIMNVSLGNIKRCYLIKLQGSLPNSLYSLIVKIIKKKKKKRLRCKYLTKNILVN